MWRLTIGWVTRAKPSRQNTVPGVSHTFSRRFSNQNYPKYISDVVSKIIEEKKQLSNGFFLNLWSSWNWVSCCESWNSLLSIFLMFHRTDFGGFLVCCYKAIQQLNGVEKNSVAISLMLNHNLTGLIYQLWRRKALRHAFPGMSLKFKEHHPRNSDWHTLGGREQMRAFWALKKLQTRQRHMQISWCSFHSSLCVLMYQSERTCERLYLKSSPNAESASLAVSPFSFSSSLSR